MLQIYWLWDSYDIRVRFWEKHKINYIVPICIARADTSLWKKLKSAYNIGNVGNTDRWNVVHFANREQWIEEVYKTLNNRYLWSKQTIGDLSFAWNCKIKCWTVYATSNDNREKNVLNCMTNLSEKKITPDFRFRF